MKFSYSFYSLVLCLEFSETFFLFPEKQAILLCLKVCPLYCAKRHKRDTGHYWDVESPYNWPPTYFDDEEDHPYPPYYPYHGGRWVWCKPKTTTTTPKPTTTTMATTTEEPTWICEVCQKKCGTPLS